MLMNGDPKIKKSIFYNSMNIRNEAPFSHSPTIVTQNVTQETRLEIIDGRMKYDHVTSNQLGFSKTKTWEWNKLFVFEQK